MKVTREWLLETISKIPEGTELEITGHDWTLFRKSAGTYKEPKPIQYPPDNISPCAVNGIHMWGRNYCRHCEEPWPSEYRNQ